MMVYGMAGHLIRRLSQISTHVFAQHMRDAGIDLTPVQFAALDAVNANPGIDQAGVAAKIAYDRATMGGVIDRLERKGLVTRNVSKRDRRARELRLTQAGANAFSAALPAVKELQEEILGRLNDSEKKAFLELAQKAIGYPLDESADRG